MMGAKRAVPCGDCDDGYCVIDQLRARARTMNGAAPVGAGDGNTYTAGYYTHADAILDRKAADRLAAANALSEDRLRAEKAWRVKAEVAEARIATLTDLLRRAWRDDPGWLADTDAALNPEEPING